LVGPNNVGKSQILHDIHDKMSDKNRNLVILESINYELPDTYQEFRSEYDIIPETERLDLSRVNFISSNLKNNSSFEINTSTLKHLEENYQNSKNEVFENHFSKTKVAYLDASSRLQLADSIHPSSPKSGTPLGLLQVLEKSSLKSSLESERELQNNLIIIYLSLLPIKILKDYCRYDSCSIPVN